MTDRVLPRIRAVLDVTPSPLRERPGWIVRDPMGFTEDILLIPSWWAQALPQLDGETTERDLQLFLTRRNGGTLVGLDDLRAFVDVLDSRGFLESESFYRLREERETAFKMAPERSAVHAGSGYPDEPSSLREALSDYLDGGSSSEPKAAAPLGIAAPHVSPFGGARSYGAAYRRLDPELRDRTFVILGTSHYGEPDKLGVTKKAFTTPLGRVEVDVELVDLLLSRAPEAVVPEDYCHAVEHSVEFQVVFLQHVLRAPFKIVPILCGAFIQSFLTGAPPESNPGVARFMEALSLFAESRRERLLWILGVDLAHVGVRYGDGFAAKAHEGELTDVAKKDDERLERVAAGDADGFLELVLKNRDPLKWCGFSPLYTFLRAVRPTSGRVLSYEQWNIDPQSVVSFAGIEFR